MELTRRCPIITQRLRISLRYIQSSLHVIKSAALINFINCYIGAFIRASLKARAKCGWLSAWRLDEEKITRTQFPSCDLPRWHRIYLSLELFSPTFTSKPFWTRIYFLFYLADARLIASWWKRSTAWIKLEFPTCRNRFRSELTSSSILPAGLGHHLQSASDECLIKNLVEFLQVISAGPYFGLFFKTCKLDFVFFTFHKFRGGFQNSRTDASCRVPRLKSEPSVSSNARIANK